MWNIIKETIFWRAQHFFLTIFLFYTFFLKSKKSPWYLNTAVLYQILSIFSSIFRREESTPIQIWTIPYYNMTTASLLSFPLIKSVDTQRGLYWPPESSMIICQWSIWAKVRIYCTWDRTPGYWISFMQVNILILVPQECNIPHIQMIFCSDFLRIW